MGIKGVIDQDAKNKGKNILLLIGGSLIGAGLLTAGFKFGTGFTTMVYGNALDKMNLADPSFKEHFMNAAEKVKNSMNK